MQHNEIIITQLKWLWKSFECVSVRVAWSKVSEVEKSSQPRMQHALVGGVIFPLHVLNAIVAVVVSTVVSVSVSVSVSILGRTYFSTIFRTYPIPHRPLHLHRHSRRRHGRSRCLSFIPFLLWKLWNFSILIFSRCGKCRLFFFLFFSLFFVFWLHLSASQ